MKKIIFSLSIIIILAIAASAYYLLSNLDFLIKAGIEKYGSAATHTAVRVDKVQFKLTEGTGTLKGLTIANPEGFDTAYAFSLGEITTAIDIQSLKQEPYVINEITIRAPQIFFEVNADKKTNLNELKNRLGGGASKTRTTTKKKDAPDTSETAGARIPRIIIRRLLFADGNINVKITPLNKKDYKLKLSRLSMTNLGGKSGATPTELTKEIINRLINQAKKDIKEKGVDAELNKLKAKVNKKIESEKAKLKSASDTKLNEEKQKLKDKLKGLFNK